jgi:hypothetical protein
MLNKIRCRKHKMYSSVQNFWLGPRGLDPSLRAKYVKRDIRFPRSACWAFVLSVRPLLGEFFCPNLCVCLFVCLFVCLCVCLSAFLKK